MDGLDDLETTNENFNAVAVNFQISFNKHFRVEKIFNFLKNRVS